MALKVLLLGDFSGVHKNLAEGLRNLGVDAVDASYGNAWRQLGSTIDFEKNIAGLPNIVSRNISPFINYERLTNNDVVQFIHYTNFNPRFGINRLLSAKIARSNGKAFLVSTGCDSRTRAFFKDEYTFSDICKECLRSDQKSTSCEFDSLNAKNDEDEFLRLIDGVIPFTYEYAESYRRAGELKLMKTIPMPMNTDRVEYAENIVSGKIVFFHGLNRIGFKGTDLIRTAMENVRRRFPNDIEVVIEGKMSLTDYLKLLQRTNVVVDQTYGITYGMNAVYSMALGKVVMGGGHPPGLHEYGVATCPVIPILPNLRSIEEGIERIIERRNEIRDIGLQSRQYVERVHHYELVARQFLAAWASR